MTIDEMISRRITGIQPFNELPIDAEIWREAHAHHQQHIQLHSRALHRPGIVYGLDVIIGKGSKKPMLVVSPGVGIDSNGEVIVVTEPFKINLEVDKTTYITASFEPNLDRKSVIKVGGEDRYYRTIEGRQVIASRELPKGAFLELARIERSAADAAVKEPKDPLDPDKDELNLLFRSLAFPHCYADCAVGELCFLPTEDPSAWKPNRAGLLNLLRFANGAGFHIEYSGLYNLRTGSAKTPSMLYVAAAGQFKALTDDQIEGLKNYLGQGGTLVAEASGGSKEFMAGLEEVFKKIGANPKPVAEGSPLLTNHHLFPGAPQGGSEGTLSADLDAGVVVSSRDYGSAWGGKLAKGDSGRERVREALEFGLNLLVLSSRRSTVKALEKLV